MSNCNVFYLVFKFLSTPMPTANQIIQSNKTQFSYQEANELPKYPKIPNLKLLNFPVEISPMAAVKVPPIIPV